MHDEDNFKGLKVTRDLDGKTWTAYGDKMLIDAADEQNEKCVIQCLQADADEVWKAYETKQVKDASQFAAWKWMPKVVPGDANHKPLWDQDGKLRNFSPRVMQQWPEEYCKVKDIDYWPVYQQLKEVAKQQGW